MLQTYFPPFLNLFEPIHTFEEKPVAGPAYHTQKNKTPQKTKIKVKLEDGKPKITCNISVNSKILSVNENYDFSSEEARQKIEAEINKFLEDSCTAFLCKTAQEYGADVIGFEGYFNKNFLTQDQIDKYDWKELYKNATFEVTSTNHLLSGFLFSKT